MLLLSSIVVLALVLTYGALALSRARSSAADRLAAEPVTVNAESVDAAEALWEFCQLDEYRDLAGLAASTRSPQALVDALQAGTGKAASWYSLEQSGYLRRERMALLREALIAPADSLLRTAAPTTVDILAMSIVQAAGSAAAAEALSSLTEEAIRALAVPSPVELLMQHSPMTDHVVDAGVSALGAGVGEAAGAVLGAHVPIFTLALAGLRFKSSRAAGLEGRRAAENLAWDAGVKGGAVMAGAAVGTMIVPVIGTAVGGLIGGIAGGQAARLGKQRHLNEARRKLRVAAEELARSVEPENLAPVLVENSRCLRWKQQRSIAIQGVYEHARGSEPAWKRVFNPSANIRLLHRTALLAAEDVRSDRALDRELQEVLTSSQHAPLLRAYLWRTTHRIMTWQDLRGPDPEQFDLSVDRYEQEVEKVGLAGARR